MRVILADVSRSMNERANAEQRRIDVLQLAFSRVIQEAIDTQVIAFGSDVLVLDRGARLPFPQGGTALTEALDAAAAFHPQLLIVLSDGEPNNANTALAAARRLNCRIVGVFCGDPIDHAAALFMQRLGWCSPDGLGEYLLANLRQPGRLEGELRRLLLGSADNVTALATADQRKLLRLLGMSGADNDGEALNSIRLAHTLVRKHGLSLTEAVEGISGAKAAALDLARLDQLQAAAFERGRLAALDEAKAAALPPWRQMRDHALTACPNLRSREREFLVDLEQRFSLTDKQQSWLVAIYNRCPARLP